MHGSEAEEVGCSAHHHMNSTATARLSQWGHCLRRAIGSCAVAPVLIRGTLQFNTSMCLSSLSLSHLESIRVQTHQFKHAATNISPEKCLRGSLPQLCSWFSDPIQSCPCWEGVQHSPQKIRQVTGLKSLGVFEIFIHRSSLASVYVRRDSEWLDCTWSLTWLWHFFPQYLYWLLPTGLANTHLARSFGCRVHVTDSALCWKLWAFSLHTQHMQTKSRGRGCIMFGENKPSGKYKYNNNNKYFPALYHIHSAPCITFWEWHVERHVQAECI